MAAILLSGAAGSAKKLKYTVSSSGADLGEVTVEGERFPRPADRGGRPRPRRRLTPGAPGIRRRWRPRSCRRRRAAPRTGRRFSSALAVTTSPAAVTISTASRLSMVRPYLPISQPSPPPRVSPAMPVVETTPPVVASPWQAAARLSSFQVTPPCAQTVRRAGSTLMPFIGARSIIRPPSVTARPATPWPPPRTEISAACSRPRFTASTTSGTVRQRAMSAGCLLISPLCTRRVSSYTGSAGSISSPVNDALTWSGTTIALCIHRSSLPLLSELQVHGGRPACRPRVVCVSAPCRRTGRPV